MKDIGTISELSDDLEETVVNTPAVNVALDTLAEIEPDVTYTFLSDVVTMENFYVRIQRFLC